MNLLFSVIIPAYNAEKYIAESIQSALDQQDVTFEILVVNDGSNDNSLDIVRAFGNCVKIINQKNSGPAFARNTGAKASKGNVLAFLDADDVWLPNKLITQQKKILSGFPFVYSNRYNFGNSEYPIEVLSDKLSLKEGDLWFDLLFMNMMTASSVVILKRVFDNLNGFRDGLRYCEDWDLWLRCAEYHQIGYCPEPLLKYRIDSNGLSKNFLSMAKMREKVVLSSLTSPRARNISAL